MLREKYENEVWAYVLDDRSKKVIPLNHWEILFGRSKSCDVVINDPSADRVQGVLSRSESGAWTLHGIFTKSNVSVNGRVCGENGMSVHTGDVIGIGRKKVVFEDIPASKRAELDSRREAAGYAIGPGLTLLGLTVFQAFLMLEQTANAAPENIRSIALGYSALALLEWFCYAIMRSVGRTGFEVETLAFFLSTIGLSVVASSAPEDILKEILLLIAGIALFFLLGWWLRDLERTKKYRFAVAALSLILLVLNLALSTVTNGARNWIEIGGFSIQPSELIKVAYIYVGAATLDRLFSTKNLIRYIIFSAICVMGLAIMGEFGTALIFFATFLVISYMRSGSIATVALALTGAGMAGFMVLSIRPYVAQRFANWGHVWEDVYGTGYQQTRTMSAAAAGGLFGKGAGNGWLKDIFAANTDMVFGVICEELGLLIALLAILAVLVLAFFAVRSAAHGRSSYYVIAACATGSMLLIQLSLNVFGSMDILPFTGVTFPFVSKGGTSLLSCWMLLAFIKAADTRRGASFVVRSASRGSDSDAEGGEEAS